MSKKSPSRRELRGRSTTRVATRRVHVVRSIDAQLVVRSEGTMERLREMFERPPPRRTRKQLGRASNG